MTLRTLSRCIAWVLIVAVVVATVSPIELRPDTWAPPDLERFAAALVITGALCVGYPRHRFGIVVMMLGLIGLFELAQYFIPGRHGTPHDALVKAGGAIIGAAMARLTA